MPIADETNPYATSPPIGNLDPASVPALKPPQSVRFVPSTEGIVAFTLYRTRRNPAVIAAGRKGRRINLTTALVVLAIAALLIWIRAGEPFRPTKAIFPASLLLMSAWYLWSAVRSEGPEAAAAKLRSGVEAINDESSGEPPPLEITLTIDASGVATADKFETAHCLWEGFDKVVIEPYFLFLIRSSMGVFIIPRMSFPSEHAYLGFANLAKQLHQEHGPKPTVQ